MATEPQRIVVPQTQWDSVWEKYRSEILGRFELLHESNESEDDKRKINWSRECADRALGRCKGELDGTYRPTS